MQIQIEHDGATAVVALRGDLDASTATDFESAVLPLIDESVVHLVVKAEALDFVDSCGLRSLVRAREQLVGKGGSLEVQGPSPTVRRVLAITQLEEAFGVA